MLRVSAVSKSFGAEAVLSSVSFVISPGERAGLVDLGRDPIDDDRTVLDIAGLRAGYDGHLVLNGVDLLIRGRDRVALMGENGSGKTTLLRCITDELPHAGKLTVGPSVRMGLLAQEGAEPRSDRTVLEVSCRILTSAPCRLTRQEGSWPRKRRFRLAG